MGGMGVWVVGVPADGAPEEARRRFPDAAGAHGTWSEPSGPSRNSHCRSRHPRRLSSRSPTTPFRSTHSTFGLKLRVTFVTSNIMGNRS
jgi:hypothetical protein